MTTNPWPDERVVVVSDDPPSVEAAVTQLEAWGAQPAVMFERSRALAALSVREQDLVVLEFGRESASASGVLLGLEELQPMLPGAAHPAPVVALAEGDVGARLEQDAWAPLHVTPHDDPVRVREALLAALEDTVAVPLPVATATVTPTAVRLVVPVVVAALAVAFAGIGVASFLALRGASEPSAVVPDPSVVGPTASPSQANVVPPTAAPAATGTIASTAAPTTAPTTAAVAVPTLAPTSAPTVAPTLAPTPVPRLPVTGGR